MRGRRCLIGAGVLSLVTLAGLPSGTGAAPQGRCIAIRAQSDTTAGLRNSCSECQIALIGWCDGFAISVTVPAGSERSINAFPQCSVRTLAERPCTPGDDPRDRGAHYRRASPKRLTAIPNLTARTAADPGQTAAALAGGAAGPAASSGHSGEAAPPSSVYQAALNVQVTGQIAERARPAWYGAVFPGASGSDWAALICSVAGENLIGQTEALLRRKEFLQAMLAEVGLNPEPGHNPEEWTSALKEVSAIERELARFQDRAKAIVLEFASR